MTVFGIAALVIVIPASMVGLFLFAMVPLNRALEAERRRTSELLDRLQASSLAEYHAVATPNAWPEDEPAGRWLHDPTGLVSTFVPDGED